MSEVMITDLPPIVHPSQEPALDLLELAVKGVVTVLPGAANSLYAGHSRGTVPLGHAINLFGPPILDVWREALTQKSPQTQLQAISRLRSLSGSDSRQQVLDALQRHGSPGTGEDRELALEYLSAIPVAVRRCPLPQLDHGLPNILPSLLMSGAEQALVGLLPTDVPPLPIGSHVAGTSYRLEELLGMGGFGAVYKARNRFEQNQPPRAIKFCLDPAMVPTLNRERVILDRLMAVDGSSWSNRIVRLYGYALDVTPPFLVYEFVPGGDLTSHIAAQQRTTGRGFEPQRVLHLIRQLVEALAFAHSQGLVHRDLKPANVLVSGDSVKLTDFGIGGVVATHTLCTLSAGSAGFNLHTAADQARLFRGSGTPLYMCAEQRRGDQPDPRHDLYSLGVLWYQLLIGDVSRELHPGWPDELREEFETPETHIESIQRCVGYFKKRPIDAQDLLSQLETAFGAGTGAIVGSNSIRVGERPGRDGNLSLDHLKMTLVDQIDRDALLDARDTATTLLQRDSNDSESLQAVAFIDSRLKKAICQEHIFTGHDGWVRTVAVSSDGRWVLSGADDGSVRLWDVAERREAGCFSGHAAAVMGVVFDPHGRWFASAGWDGVARVWDTATGTELRVLTGPWQALKCLAVAPSGRYLLTAGDDRAIRIWDHGTGSLRGCLEGHSDLVQSLAFAADDRKLVSGSDDGTVRVWDLAAGEQTHCLEGHKDTVTAVAWVPGSSLILSASSDRTVRLWDLTSGETVGRLIGHENWVNTIAVLPGGQHVITGSGGELRNGQFHDGSDTTIRLWHLRSGAELCRFTGQSASVTAIALSPCGSWLAAGGLDQTVRLLRLPH